MQQGFLSVIVTGGASGIGAATARRIVAAGGHVGLADINEAGAAALAKELGTHAAAAACDTLDERQVAAVHAAFAGKLPPINGLVNCAGIPPMPKPIEATPTEEFVRLVNSHVTGTYIACRIIGAEMARRGHGAIVNVASVLAFRAGPVLGYGAGKAAVVNLTEALAVQWGHRGVRVNAVAPGWTDTPFLYSDKARNAQRDLTPILAATPMGRLMKPEEIAEVIFFLLSPGASAVTGATVSCDGGVMAGSGWAPYGGLPAG